MSIFRAARAAAVSGARKCGDRSQSSRRSLSCRGVLGDAAIFWQRAARLQQRRWPRGRRRLCADALRRAAAAAIAAVVGRIVAHRESHGRLPARAHAARVCAADLSCDSRAKILRQRKAVCTCSIFGNMPIARAAARRRGARVIVTAVLVFSAARRAAGELADSSELCANTRRQSSDLRLRARRALAFETANVARRRLAAARARSRTFAGAASRLARRSPARVVRQKCARMRQIWWRVLSGSGGEWLMCGSRLFETHQSTIASKMARTLWPRASPFDQAASSKQRAAPLFCERALSVTRRASPRVRRSRATTAITQSSLAHAADLLERAN